MEGGRILIVFTILIAGIFRTSSGQSEVEFPLTLDSFKIIWRSFMLAPPGRAPVISNVFVRLYTDGDEPTSSYRLEDLSDLLNSSSFDVQKPTMLYAHGYAELVTDESVRTIIKAYQDNKEFNILVLDWSNLAFGNYLVAALGVTLLGSRLGEALQASVSAGLPLDKLHLVGHSLGAHVVGQAARELAAGGAKVPRLTGLDPALPAFYPPLVGPHIDAEDALFVDIVHTDGRTYGTPARTGHADFWPNGGTAVQPGCYAISFFMTTQDFCSHWRSWAFWAESVKGGDFKARSCTNYDEFLRGKCSENPLASMGLKATNDLHGNYYLNTAAKSPYALGERGAYK